MMKNGINNSQQNEQVVNAVAYSFELWMQSRYYSCTCPVSPARVVVKFTSEIIADPSGGSSGLGLRVVMNNLKFKETGKILNNVMLENNKSASSRIQIESKRLVQILEVRLCN